MPISALNGHEGMGKHQALIPGQAEITLQVKLFFFKWSCFITFHDNEEITLSK